MSVSVQTPYKKYTAAAAATVFPTTFRVVLAGDLQVTVDSVVVTTGFTLSTLGLSAGVDVTFTTPMVGGEIVELQRIIPKSRVNDYQQLGNFDASVVNADIDRLWMSNQELGEEIDRAVKVPIGSTIDPDQLIADLLATQAAAEAAAADAEADKLAAQAAAAAAAASAASTGLPALTGKTLNFLRVKADESGYEARTPAQVLSDISAASISALTKSMWGFTYQNNVTDAVNDIDITAGGASDSTGAAWLSVAAMTKKLDAPWVAGTNQGGLSSSLTIGNNDYYIHAIRVGGVDDIGFDTSPTAANLIADHSATHYRPIGWFKRVGGTIVAFNTYEREGGGLEMRWNVPTLDVNLADTLTTTRRTDAVKVPLNFSTIAMLRVILYDSIAAFQARIGCPDEADGAMSLIGAPGSSFNVAANVTSTAEMQIRTDATGKIAAKSTLATVEIYALVTVGFLWSRR